jgi:hypothetical protein
MRPASRISARAIWVKARLGRVLPKALLAPAYLERLGLRPATQGAPTSRIACGVEAAVRGGAQSCRSSGGSPRSDA